MDSSNQNLHINVGGLKSIQSVYNCASHGLVEFNKLWELGEVPTVTWDLRDIQSGSVNIAAASFFLAIAHRVRSFTKCKQSCLIEWNPKVFGFLSDIGFFKLANSYDLIDWPIEIEGYDYNRTNPNTVLLTCNPLQKISNYRDNNQISEFKRIHREHYRQYVIDKCEALFTAYDQKRLGDNVALTMSRTCAELATNSLLWGRATPFLGLQRSGKKITISITDIGVGFKSSFIEKGQFLSLLKNKDSDIVSVALGSVVNKFGFGLRRAISTVIDLDGSISITSNSGEILWGKALWLKFLSYSYEHGVEASVSVLPGPIYKAKSKDRNEGFVRDWSKSIRGSRIQFSIPLD